MNYKPRPGIALIKLCGAQVLVPTRQASTHCSRIRALSVTEIIVWRGLERELSQKRIGELCGIFLRKSEEELRAYVEETIQKFLDDGFLIEVPDEEDVHDAE